MSKPAPSPSKITTALSNLHAGVKTCPVTFALIDADQQISPLYDHPARDKSTVLVVEEPLDIYAFEQTGDYRGTYHVLGGAVSPIDGITPDQLHICELIDRIRTDQVSEVIIATNPPLRASLQRYCYKKCSAKLTLSSR